MTNVISRRRFLNIAGASLAGTLINGCSSKMFTQAHMRSETQKPNFVIIFCDDMGYGDLACFGSTKNRTPNLDQMAGEGMKFTDFYVTSGVCTPSRSSLLTGCYPKRVDMHQDSKGRCVLFCAANKGLNPNEITIAELLKQQGYATCCIGKWHLGDQPKFLPTRQGFDYYYGIPYSNDMGGEKRNGKRPPLPLMQNEKVIEAPANQNTLTKRYTAEALEFIKKNKSKPFFIYLPHSMVHNPLHASKNFRGKSDNGIYGDAVEEIDFSTGQILDTLKKLDLDKNTLVVFTSDNGASNQFGGSNAPLRGHKGSTWEGGMREPCLMWWPGHIPAGKTCSQMAITMDLLPTFTGLAGASLPVDREIDGRNIWPLMSRAGAKSPHEAFYYYQIDQLQAVRSGKWKLHLALKQKKKNWGEPEPDSPLQLYDLEADIGETTDVAEQHPDVVKRLMKLARRAKLDLGDVEIPGLNTRPAGWVVSPRPLLLKK